NQRRRVRTRKIVAKDKAHETAGPHAVKSIPKFANSDGKELQTANNPMVAKTLLTSGVIPGTANGLTQKS
ncbi:hypothetical protein, partial [Vibrio cholerae]|uniref:hypothetical protein n=1 Tax=Vibrio cholerae TaxID=666 RepID=UPI001F2959F4